VGLINIVFEVEGISEGEATYPSLVLSVGLFWIESVLVSFSSGCLVPIRDVGASPSTSNTLHRGLYMPH
jgi:hypothetical protein